MSRSTKCTYAGTLSWGGDEPTAELEVEWSYTVLWGAPATGPTYACGGRCYTSHTGHNRYDRSAS